MSGLSQQQEAFCAHVVEGCSQTEAYAKAGYKGDEKQLAANASRLIANDKVSKRIAELREKATEKTLVTVASITQMLIETHAAAKNAKDLTNERACAMDIAKLNGLIIDKSSVKSDNTQYIVSDKPLSEDEWAEKYSSPSMATH